MRNLRVIRVDETSATLYLSDSGGREYSLPVDDELLNAVTELTSPDADNTNASESTGDAGLGDDQPQAGPQASEDPATAASRTAPQGRPLKPREIQARIREGATAQQLVEETGTDLKLIQSYEGPILAERHYRAQQAQNIEVSAPQNNEGYRAAFGDNPANLGDMVRARLRANGVDLETLRWDSWKVNTGAWTVIADFELPEGAVTVGGEPPAEWTFHPTRRHLENRNRWAQVLSEWEPWDFSAPPRRLVPVADEPDQPFNVEEGGEHGNTAPADSAPVNEPEHDDSDHELLDVLTRRRGTRVGEDAEGDDALAHLIAQSHQDRERSGANTEAPDRTDGQHLPDVQNVSFPPLRRVPDPIPASSHTGNDEEDRKSRDNASQPLWGDSHNSDRETDSGSSHGRHAGSEHENDGESNHKKRRSKMPSWDEIVFGRGARHPDDE